MREAQPHLVTLLGEPGIGKSRFAAEFTHGVLGDVALLHGRCPPYGEALGYWALAAKVKSAAGITAEDDAAAARAKLSGLVETATGEEEAGNDAGELARYLDTSVPLPRTAGSVPG